MLHILVKLKTLAVRSSSRLGAPSGSFGPLGTDKVPGILCLDATEPDGGEEGAAAPSCRDTSRAGNCLQFMGHQSPGLDQRAPSRSET